MIRAFNNHSIRSSRSLDGLWDFRPEVDGKHRGKFPRVYSRQIQVPSVWESLPDLRDFRGTAWYRKKFTLTEDCNVRLVFGGVSHTGKVWVDGNEVGEHYDAFTPWDVVIPRLKAGEHDVVVEVDNSFGEHSALHIPNDYYTYGGISRPVEIQQVPDQYIEHLFAVPRLYRGKWQLDVRVRVKNIGDEAAFGMLKVHVASEELLLTLPKMEPGDSGEISGTLRNLSVKPWSELNPQLYDLQAELWEEGSCCDDMMDRVGFREIKVKGKKLMLNGEEVHLRGFNRHEDAPIYGCAIPPALMAHDLDLFKDLNCNFLRTCHYPNDHRLLDMCDERGIYVWEESHSRQTPLDAPHFEAQIETNTREMVEHHFNHPCILMWGSLNECETRTEDGEDVHRRVMAQLKTLDASRPVTYAGMWRKEDRCLQYADIVSWNNYTGWYGGGPEDIRPDIDDMLAWLDSNESSGKGKPVIISEFGAGAIPGCRNPQADLWSEEYQCIYLEEALNVFLQHPRINGAAIWQFCDIRVSNEPNESEYNGYTPMGRPRCMNNKGVVDEHRRPKLSYPVVKAKMLTAVKKRGKV
ncbi:glycoside hydrolase family 2 TIM barrel-domain containing protein [Kiritimatiellaeota bacterium B1221]|nr:glycoside hydrolase family 2 TIM barrel-domain containing protein [Kiritimatiellaeota bacterium B1221]